MSRSFRFRSAPSLALASVLLAASVAASGSRKFVFPLDFNPQFCPNTLVRQQIKPEMASDCKGIVITWGMCRNCHMRTHDAKGDFLSNPDSVNNRDMYDLASPQCQRAMRNYAYKNPCDKPRVEHITQYHKGLRGKLPKWKTREMQKKLGEFMYNVCELCCDCVPIGLSRKRTLAQEYWFRRKQDNGKSGENGLIQVYRGNCPVHYYYDTCRMWPNITDIARRKEDLDTSGDSVCFDHVYPWWNVESNRRNWLRDPEVDGMSERFVNFLVKINKVLGCRNKRVWTDCARLELAQKRV